MTSEARTSEKVIFANVKVGRYFVWARSPELGPLLKCDAGSALDLDDREHRIDADEEIVTS